MESFKERQFLGCNKYSNLLRLVIILFCFGAYYVLDYGDEMINKMFLILGLFMLLLSGALTFILHFETKVQNGFVVLDGLWTSRKVKINLQGIQEVYQVQYNPIYLKNPVFNLHRKGRILFYNRGIEALVLIDQEGLEYVIGTQKVTELENAVNLEIEKLKSGKL
jgi:hypothetical protein